jgi:hypothetical protein
MRPQNTGWVRTEANIVFLSLYCNLTPSVLCSRRGSPAEIFGHNLILISYFLLQNPPFSLRICSYNISKNGPFQISWNFETKELETALEYRIFLFPQDDG